MVEKFVTITPRHVKLSEAEGSAVVTIIPEKKYPFQIVRSKADKGLYIQYELKAVTRGNRPAYQLTVENTRKEKGRYFDTIQLTTDNSLWPELAIWVYGDIKEGKN